LPPEHRFRRRRPPPARRWSTTSPRGSRERRPRALALARGIARDTELEGRDEATRLHRDRYHGAELIYLAEVGPRSVADVVIDNRDFTNPRLLTPEG
jgi:hypothetical protein